MEKPHGEKAVRLALALLVAGVAALQLSHWFSMTPRELTERGQLVDDAFFYAVLARNHREYGTLTMDGEMPTNGVQPLWMATLVGADRLLGGSDPLTVLVRSSALLYLAFAFCVSWALAIGRPRQALTATAAAAGLLLWNTRFQGLVLTGLETPLTLLLVVLTVLAIDHVKRRADAGAGDSPRILEAAVLGLLGASCFFARTDLFWIAAASFGWLCFAARGRWSPPLAFASVVAVLVVPYLAANALAQGSIMPMSGRVKLYYMNEFYPTLAAYLRSPEWHGLSAAFGTLPLLGRRSPLAVTILALLLVGGAAWIVARDTRERVFPAGLRVLGLAIVCHLLFMAGFYRELRPYTSYYFAPTLVWLAMVASRGLARLAARDDAGQSLHRSPAALGGALGLAIVALLGWHDRTLSPVPYWQARIGIAREAADRLGSVPRFSAFWPGTVAYFSNGLVTPLDGVIGSNHYFEHYVKTGRELAYPLERGRRHLVIYLPRDPLQIVGAAVPRVGSWENLGVARLAELEGDVEVVAGRPIDAGGRGWYLLRLPSHRQVADRLAGGF